MVNSVAMDFLLTDIQYGYDGDMWKDCFAPGLVYALENMINDKSGLNELQKWWNLDSNLFRIFKNCGNFCIPSTAWMFTILPSCIYLNALMIWKILAIWKMLQIMN